MAQPGTELNAHEICGAVARYLQLAPKAPSPCPMAAAGLAGLRTALGELRAGRVPVARIRDALTALGKTEDIALRAPEAVGQLHALAHLFGLA